MKRFGFHPDQLYFNIYNSRKVRYLQHPELGNFEAPKTTSRRSSSLKDLHANYQKRLEFEHYMNPKGYKPTITSHFRKPQREIEFVNHEVQLMRTPKDYGKEWVNFRVNNFLSKPELQQYLMKMYGMNI